MGRCPFSPATRRARFHHSRRMFARCANDGEGTRNEFWETPMTANRVDTEPAATIAVDVRLCDRCTRALPALDKNEYTPARADVITTAGFCVCPPGGPDGLSPIPDHGPSLL
jgi:hypothetical protein